MKNMIEEETLYTEEQALDAFKGTISKISGQHNELTQTDYFLLLLRNKTEYLKKLCQKK